MNNNQIKCPGCGAPIYNKYISETVKCSYCGSVIEIDPKVLEQRRLNEKAEFEKKMLLEEARLEKENEKKYEKSKRVKIIGIIILGLIAFAGYGIGYSSISNTGFIMIGIIALLGCVLLYSNLSDQKKNPSKRTNHNYAEISDDIKYCKEKNYADVSAKLKSLGFVNIECIALGDLNFFTKGMSGKIESISIDGDNNFDEGYYPKDSIITITYHSDR